MKIRSHILLKLLTISLSSIIILGSIQYFLIEESLNKNIEARLSSQAEILNSYINESVISSVKLSEMNTNRPALLNALGSYLENPNEVDYEKLKFSFVKSQIKEYDILNAIIVDLNGNVVISTDPNSQTNSYDINKFQSAKLGESSANFTFDNTKTLVLKNYQPMTLNDKVIAVMITETLPPNMFVNPDFSGLGDTGEYILVMKDENDKISIISPTRFSLDENIISSEEKQRPAAFALSGNNGIHYDLYDYRDTEVISYTKFIPDLELGLVVKIDQIEAYLPNETIKNIFILSFILVTIGMIITSIIISNRLSIPVKELKQATEEIAYGDLSIKITPKGPTELIQLGQSVNKMVLSLKALNEQRTNFLAMISHELKTPITPILGRCEMLYDKELGSLAPAQVKCVDEIYQNGSRLQRLIGDILESQRIRFDKLTIQNEKISGNELMKTLFEHFKPIVDEKRIEFKTFCPRQIQFTSDKQRIFQVLTNLVKNAIDFTPNELGRITVNVDEEENDIIFSVSDNGIGISPEKQNKIFKEFFQVDTSPSRKQGGTGLGLAICKGIVDALEGQIWCDSKIGKGTTFFFTIPKNRSNK